MSATKTEPDDLAYWSELEMGLITLIRRYRFSGVIETLAKLAWLEMNIASKAMMGNHRDKYRQAYLDLMSLYARLKVDDLAEPLKSRKNDF